MRKFWKSLCKIVAPHLPKNIGLFFAVAFASTLLADYLTEGLAKVIPGFATPGKTFNVFCGIAAGFIIDLLISTRGKKAIALNQLEKTLEATHHGAELAEYYCKIASERFSSEVENEIRSLKDAKHEFKGEFLPKAIELAKHWKNNVEANERWRLLMQILLSSELNSVKANDFSMTLKTYLRILLTTIDLAISTANSRVEKLVIASFTNALPSDWFHDTNPVVGESMESYAKELTRRITEIRSRGYSYIRHILCSEELGDRGFNNRAEVEKNWVSCSLKEKETYLSEMHSTEDDAYIVELYPEIEFSSKFTELIYFGFQREEVVRWDWCYACAYTNDNRNVSARFINLEKDGFDVLINVKNIHGRLLGDYVATPANIKVSIGDFPNHFRNVAKTFRIKDIFPLAKKWDIASQIWHDEHEQELVRNLFKKILPQKAKILDCGCGTGFHSFLLQKAGFCVTATDSDGANIEILNNRKNKIGIEVNAQKVGWLDLPSSIHERFDCVACLGSSITYYESWDEKVHDLGNQAAFRDIIHSFKSMLKPNGILVIGISRHYDMGINGHGVSFKPKSIDGHTYNMEWVLRWSNMHKTWECKIVEEPSGNDYSFSLVSHMIDRNELMNLCREFFAEVTCIDLDNSFYDIFIICSDEVATLTVSLAKIADVTGQGWLDQRHPRK